MGPTIIYVALAITRVVMTLMTTARKMTMVMTLMMMNCEVDSACMRKWMVGALSRILDRPEQTTDDSPLSAYDDHITIVQHEHF